MKGGMTITPDELLWVKGRIELAKSISFISQQQQQQQQQRRRSPTDDAEVNSAIGIPPIAAAVVPPMTMHSMSPMVPLVVSAATMPIVINPLYPPQSLHHHPYPQPSASIMPNTTASIQNTLLPSQCAVAYRYPSEGDYNGLLPPLPAAPAPQTQLPESCYSSEDELTKKITRRIQEKLNRLNPSIINDKQHPQMDFPRDHDIIQHNAKEYISKNATEIGHATLSESVEKNHAPMDATTQFEIKTADFEMKSEIAVGLIRKRVGEIIARGSIESLTLSDTASDTIPTTLTKLNNTHKEKLDIKQPAKRNRRNQPNIAKISEELDNFLEKCLDDDNIRCALIEDKVNNQLKREDVNGVYKKCIKDVESRLKMYTKLERLAEQIAARRMTRGKKRNSSSLDRQIEGDCDTIRLLMRNFRMLEDEMDRIIGISHEEI